MLYQAANRDPAVYPNPESFDITRNPNPHLAFGIGNHFCLGANLSRMEIRVAIEALMQRYPDMKFKPGTEPQRMASVLFRGNRVDAGDLWQGILTQILRAGFLASSRPQRPCFSMI